MKSIVKLQASDGMIKYRIFVKGDPLKVYDILKKELENNCP